MVVNFLLPLAITQRTYRQGMEIFVDAIKEVENKS